MRAKHLRHLDARVAAALAVVSLTAFARSAPAQATARFIDADSTALAVDEYMRAAVQADHFSGSILVAKGGRPVISRGYGMASYELDVPNTPRTRFRIASLTKAFTAAAILLLQERGTLDVDDAICRHLDACPPAWRPITVGHLLTHTSGIPNYTEQSDYETVARNPATDEEIVARFRDRPLEFTPGARYAYNNSGYHLLGMIIEKVSGKSYGDFVRENILLPLGMHDSGRDVGRAIVKNRAAGYTLENDQLVNAAFQEMAAVGAEGGLYSTTEDMLRWERALASESLLRRASLDAMFTPFRNGYGYGWTIAELFGRKEMHHSGRVFGFATHIKRFPADQVAVIVLSNNQMTDADQIAGDLSAIVFGAPYRVPRVGKFVARQVLESYTGRYEVSPTTTVTVLLRNDKLFAQGTGSGPTELLAASETEFFLKLRAADVRMTFNRDAAGRVTSFTILKDGVEQTARRIDTP